jgi:CheY-like chemotaxis protein
MKRLKILLVDDDNNDILLTRRSLESKSCEVVSATSVTEAIKQIASQPFDVLITDLHMPDPGDGFAVVTAMRHFQPQVLNLVCSSYPDVQKSMAAILLQADDVLVKPFAAEQLVALVDKRKLTARPSLPPSKESVASILDRDVALTITRWLSRMEEIPELTALPLTAQERTKFLPAIIASITARLRAAPALEAKDCVSSAAVAHGQVRCAQGYTAPLIVQESRLLQVCIFETIERNLATVDFTKVLPDIMIIADEVDCQLKQAIDSFLTVQRGGAALASSA